MEHHGAHEEDNQWAILEEYPDAFHRAALLACICATGEFVINLAGSDQMEDQNRGTERATTKKKLLRLETKYPRRPIDTAAITLPAELNV